MPHKRKTGQMCPGRPYQEPTTMAIKCSVCREPIGPPTQASRPKTIAASPQGVDAMLRQRLHPEEAAAENQYADSIQASTSDALSMLQKNMARQEQDQKERDAVLAQQAAMRNKTEQAMTATGPVDVPAGAATAVLDAPPEVGADLLTSDGEGEVAPEAAPETTPSIAVVSEPTMETPPLMAALQAAAAEGEATKPPQPVPQAQPAARGRRR